MPVNQTMLSKPANRGLLGSAVRIIGMLLVALLLIAVGLIAYLFSQPERLKYGVEQTITALTGRVLSINGVFEAELGREIHIYAEQIQWANAPWSSQPYLLKIEQIDVAFDLLSLLEPPVIIKYAHAKNGRLEFEWDSAGVSNWDFYANEPDDGKAAAMQALPLLLDTAQLNQVELTFRTPDLSEPVTWVIEAAAQQQDQASRLVIGADTRIEDRAIRLDAVIGPFPQLAVAGAVDMEAYIAGPAAVLEASGSTTRLSRLEGLNLKLDWHAPEIADVLGLINFRSATSGPLALQAELSSQDGRVEGKVDGDLGEFLIDSTFSAPADNLLTDLHMNFSATGPEANVLGILLGMRGLPRTPFKLSFSADSTPDGLKISDFYGSTADAEIKGGALLPRPPTLVDGEINLQASGKDLSRFQGLTNTLKFPADKFVADLTLRGNGKSSPDLLSANFSVSRLTGKITADLTERPDYAGSMLQYELDVPDAQRFASFFGAELAKTAGLRVAGAAEVTAPGLQLKDLKLQLAANRVSLTGLIPWEFPREAANLSTRTSGPEFRDFSSFYIPNGLGPSAPFEFEGTVNINSKRVHSEGQGKVGSTTLSTDGDIQLDSPMPKMDFKIAANGPNLDEWLQDFVLEERIKDSFELQVNVSIEDQKLSITNSRLQMLGATLQGNLSTQLTGDAGLSDNLRFDLTASGKNLAQELPKFSAYEPAPVAYQLAVRGSVNKSSITLDRAEGNLGSVQLSISGSVGLTPENAGQRFNVDARGERLSDLGTIEGWTTEDAPFEIVARINSGETAVEAEKLSLTIGESDLRGNVRLTLPEPRQLTAKVESRGLNIGALLTREQNAAVDDYLNAVDDDTVSERVIPETAVPRDLLESLNADVTVKIDRAWRGEDELFDVLIDSTLQDGTLELTRLQARTTYGGIKGAARLIPTGDAYDVEASFTANKVRIPQIKRQSTGTIPYKGSDIDLYLQGSGANIRAIAGDLNGYVWLRGEKRQLENVKYSSIFGDAFDEIFKLVNPFYKKDPYTNIECEAYLFEIDQGVMETSPVVFVKTDKVNFVAAGTINLKNEKLKLGIETIPRKGIGLSASDLLTPFVRIGGTMADPRAAVDAKGSLIEGGAAFYTMGLSIVAKSLYQRWIKADKECVDYVALARETRRARDPDHVPSD